APQRFAAQLALADPDRGGRLSGWRARGLRLRGTGFPRATTDLGTFGTDRGDPRGRATSSRHGRLPGHVARPTHGVRQPHPAAGPLHRRGQCRESHFEAPDMNLADIRIRVAGPEPELAPALTEILIDCVEGGASVSFMWPLPYEKALA